MQIHIPKYIRNSYNSTAKSKQNKTNPIKKKKWKEELNRHFPKDIQMSTGTKTGAQYH